MRKVGLMVGLTVVGWVEKWGCPGYEQAPDPLLKIQPHLCSRWPSTSWIQGRGDKGRGDKGRGDKGRADMGRSVGKGRVE